VYYYITDDRKMKSLYMYSFRNAVDLWRKKTTSVRGSPQTV